MGLIWKKRKLEVGMLILVAIEDELKRSNLPNYQIEYIGVGKVNAVFNTLNAIQKHSPQQIINFGTAGSIDTKIKGLVEASRFFQRDMDASPLGFELGQTPFEEDIEITFGREGVTCGTGDEFVTSTPKLKTDIVDMEAFAIAKACKLKILTLGALNTFQIMQIRKQRMTGLIMFHLAPSYSLRKSVV